MAIGQPTMESGQPDQGRDPSAATLDGPFGLAPTDGGGLFVADYRNNRVLFYGSVAEGGPAAAVLGQPDFHGSAPATSRSGLNGPVAVAVGAGRMAVVDHGSNRVLIYDRILGSGEPVPEATSVLGQPDFESSAPSCGPGGLNRPHAVVISPSGKLIVADMQNNRLLVWNAIPAPGTFAPRPDLVVGQSDLDHCAFRDEDQDGVLDRENGNPVLRATARMMQPFDVWTDDKRLAVVDSSSNRVLIWNTFPTTNFQPADVVLGHADFVGLDFNDAPPIDGVRPKPTARTFADPRGIHSDGTSLAVADTYNNRVLIWSTFPQSNYQPADIVLGQPDFVGAATMDQDGNGVIDPPTAVNAQVLSRPMRVLLTPYALFISDTEHNRVVVHPR